MPDTADAFPDISDKKIMVGFWHNQQTPSVGYQHGTSASIELSQIPAEYNVVTVAFMTGSGIPTFTPDNLSDEQFRQQVAIVNQQGRPVLISLGGADAHIELATGEAQKLADEIIRLVEVYGFDGLDINLADSVISAGANQSEIPAALKRVKATYPQFIISMSPPFPALRRGGGWEVLIDNLAGYYDFIAPQYYNHGDEGVSGDNDWYAQKDDSKKAEFLYTLTDALVQGTRGYIQIPADKFVIGLPSNADAAASGYVQNEADVRSAYQRLAAQGTPVRGLMSWSVNWDAGHRQSGNAYAHQFVERFSQLVSEELATEPDSEPPGQPGKPDIELAEGQAVLSWAAASDNLAVARYHIWRNGVEIAQSLLPEWTDTQLSAGNSYEYQIVAADKAGNLSPPGESSVITVENEMPEEDSEKPATPQGLVAADMAQERLTLSWQAASDNLAIKHYRVYRNGVLISESPTTHFTDSLPDAAAIYEYQVAAVDNADNVSDKSPPLTVNTGSDNAVPPSAAAVTLQ
ncbi:chitinase [Pantoea sp. B65]